jgi:hypothetical protein
MSNYCSVCCISLSSSYKLKCHLLTSLHKKRAENRLQHICNCGRSFTKASNLSRHRKTCFELQCKTEISNTESTHVIQLLQEKLDKKDQEMKEVKDEMDELRKQVETLIGNTAKQTTNNNSNIQTQNNIENQNVIVVNSFGNENIEHLTDQIICKLIKTAPFTSVPQLIEKIHFDPDHPENHNIKITNKKMNYAEIVQNNKWVTANKKKVIDDVIQKSYNLLDEKYTDNKDTISEKRKERFENFQERYEQDNEELHRNIKNDVDLILINGTNEVHKQ